LKIVEKKLKNIYIVMEPLKQNWKLTSNTLKTIIIRIVVFDILERHIISNEKCHPPLLVDIRQISDDVMKLYVIIVLSS